MTAQKLDKLVIRTPEGFTFSMLLAGPITRFLAWLIDTFITLGALLAMMIGTSFIAFFSPDIVTAIQILLAFVIWMGYGILLEWYCRGKTIGKRILGLQVVDEHGLRITFAQIAARNLLRLADCLPLLYLVGGVVCILSRRSQRLGDIAAGTVVIRIVETSLPDLSAINTGADKYNSFSKYPHIEARLRQKISPDEAKIALQALLRRDSLDPDRRIELFSELADHFRAMLDFPPEATDGLSDEKYIHNVVDTLFRSQLKAQGVAGQ